MAEQLPRGLLADPAMQRAMLLPVARRTFTDPGDDITEEQALEFAAPGLLYDPMMGMAQTGAMLMGDMPADPNVMTQTMLDAPLVGGLLGAATGMAPKGAVLGANVLPSRLPEHLVPLTDDKLKFALPSTKYLVKKIREKVPDAELGLSLSENQVGKSNYLTLTHPNKRNIEIRLSDHATGPNRAFESAAQFSDYVPEGGKPKFGQISRESFDKRIDEVLSYYDDGIELGANKGPTAALPGLLDDVTGRAKAGGEVGVNQYFYKGGQFLPSNKELEPGSYRVQDGRKSKTVGRRKQDIAPGERQLPPTPFARSIYQGLRHLIEPAPGGKMRFIDNETALDYYLGGVDTPADIGIPGVVSAKEQFTHKELLELYNRGERWIEPNIVEEGVEVATTGRSPVTPISEQRRMLDEVPATETVLSPQKTAMIELAGLLADNKGGFRDNVARGLLSGDLPRGKGRDIVVKILGDEGERLLKAAEGIELGANKAPTAALPGLLQDRRRTPRRRTSFPMRGLLGQRLYTATTPDGAI